MNDIYDACINLRQAYLLQHYREYEKISVNKILL